MGDNNNIFDVLLNGESIKVDVSLSNESLGKLMLAIMLSIIISVLLGKMI